VFGGVVRENTVRNEVRGRGAQVVQRLRLAFGDPVDPVPVEFAPGDRTDERVVERLSE